LVGKQQPVKLSATSVFVSEEHAAVLAQRGRVLFEINPDGQEYSAYAEDRPSQAANKTPNKVIQKLDKLSRQFVALPLLDPRSADEIVGYDEFGLPR
jgi:hypothetical protein